MLGISDPQIWIGYGLAIGWTVACIAYGILMWNREGAKDNGS